MAPDESNDRDTQVRRTRSVRRGVIAVGATGALGAAVAIGTTIHAVGATGSVGVTEDENSDPGSDQGSSQGYGPSTDQAPPGGQLAAPGAAGPAHSRSSGS